MPTTATFDFNLTCVDTLATTSAPAAANRTLTNSGFDRRVVLNATSTPPATIDSYQILTGASGTIDLTALPSAAGAQDGTGKKIRGLRIYNPNATGDFQIDAGASNGYAIDGPLTVHPGAIAQIYFADGLAAVDGTHKTLDWTGTALHTFQATLVLG